MKKTEQEMEKGLFLPIVEEFHTLQGEGYHMGKPAYFIRLGGCDIGCEWCDSKFCWDNDPDWLASTDQLVARVLESGANSVVVTGGEPLLYNLEYLCSELYRHGIKTFLETSGAYPLSGRWDWICLSPKRQNPPLDDLYLNATELKVIIHSEQDFEWAEKTAQKVQSGCKLYLQPEWSRFNQMIFDIVEYIKKNQKWTVSLQAHKFMRIP